MPAATAGPAACRVQAPSCPSTHFRSGPTHLAQVVPPCLHGGLWVSANCLHVNPGRGGQVGGSIGGRRARAGGSSGGGVAWKVTYCAHDLR